MSQGGILFSAATGPIQAFGGQDGIEITGGKAAVHGGMPQRPVDVGAAGQRRQFDRVRHLLQDAFGTDGGGFFEPHGSTGTQRQKRLLGDGAGTDAVVTGNLVTVLWEVTVVDRGLPGVARRCRATSMGPPSSSAQITISSVPSW